MTPSHNTTHDTHPPLLRPIPRRANPPDHPSPPSPASPLHPSRSSDFLAQLNARLLRTTPRTDASPESPHHDSHPESAARLPRANKSFLSLAGASTLFGIYDDGGASVAETPWGAGAETPGHGAMGWVGGGAEGTGRESRPSLVESTGNPPRKPIPLTGKKKPHTTLPLVLKLSSLFAFGVLYGALVAYLHTSRHLAGMRVAPVSVGRGSSTGVVLLWGCAGVALGSLLPCVDLAWGRGRKGEQAEGGLPLSEQINAVVRSVAAFVGVAFAIVSLYTPFPSRNHLLIPKS